MRRRGRRIIAGPTFDRVFDVNDPRAPRAPWLMSCLTVRDTRKSIDFCQRAFEFQRTGVAEREGDPQHVAFSYRDRGLGMFAPEGASIDTAKAPAALGIECPFKLHVFVDDVDATHARAVAAGAKSIESPADQSCGDRFCLVEGVSGYRWDFARDIAAS